MVEDVARSEGAVIAGGSVQRGWEPRPSGPPLSSLPCLKVDRLGAEDQPEEGTPGDGSREVGAGGESGAGREGDRLGAANQPEKREAGGGSGGRSRASQGGGGRGRAARDPGGAGRGTREAGRLGRQMGQRDAAAGHAQHRRPWRYASQAAEACLLSPTTAIGAAWRPPSSVAGGTSGSRWARSGRRREPPERRRMRRRIGMPVP